MIYWNVFHLNQKNNSIISIFEIFVSQFNFQTYDNDNIWQLQQIKQKKYKSEIKIKYGNN